MTLLALFLATRQVRDVLLLDDPILLFIFVAGEQPQRKKQGSAALGLPSCLGFIWPLGWLRGEDKAQTLRALE